MKGGVRDKNIPFTIIERLPISKVGNGEKEEKLYKIFLPSISYSFIKTKKIDINIFKHFMFID